MAKAEQIITDRKKMKKILGFMEEAVKEYFYSFVGDQLHAHLHSVS